MLTLQMQALHALCLHNTSTTTVGWPFRAPYVLIDASTGARQALCSPVPSLPLSFHLMGPMGEATVVSHVFLWANDKVAATAPMNYAGWKGSNSTHSYVNLTLRRQRGESYWGVGCWHPFLVEQWCPHMGVGIQHHMVWICVWKDKQRVVIYWHTYVQSPKTIRFNVHVNSN